MEVKTAESDAAQSPSAEGEEVDTAVNEKEEEETDGNTGKSLDQNPTEEQETTDNAEEKEKADTPEDALESQDAVEVKTVAEPVLVEQGHVLVPVKVESTFVDVPVVAEPTFIEEDLVVAEPAFIEETPVIVGQAFAGETPVVATAEMSPAVVPMVAPMQGFAPFESTFQARLSPVDDVVVVGERVADSVFPSVVPAPAAPVHHIADNFDAPAGFPGFDVAFLGPFLSETEGTPQISDFQSDYDREVRTPVAVPVEARDFDVNAMVNPAVELDSVKVPMASFPQFEAIQLPSIDVLPSFQENEPELLPSQNIVSVREVPQAPLSVIQVQQSSVNPPSLPSPLPQVQILEYYTSSAAVEGSPDYDPILNQNLSPLFIREVKVSEPDANPSESFDSEIRQLEFFPAIETEAPQHRFQVTKSGRSMDSVPVRIDDNDHNPMKDLYFIPESLQLSDSKPSQSVMRLIEIPATVPEGEMIMKAKSFSGPLTAKDFEIIGTSVNELDKPTSTFDAPDIDSINLVPVDLSVFADSNQTPVQREFDFMPMQENIFVEPETTDSFSLPVQYVEVPVSAFESQEPVPFPAAEFQVLTASPAGIAPASPQSDPTLMPVAEMPAPNPIELPYNVVSVEWFDLPSSSSADASAGEPAARQRTYDGTPLLPPLMKASRILN